MCKTLYDELIVCQHFSKFAHLYFCNWFICNFNVNCLSYFSFLFKAILKNLFYSCPEVCFSSLYLFLFTIVERSQQKFVTKDLCQIKNKQTHCLHISVQQTNKLRLRIITNWRLVLVFCFTSLTCSLPVCFLKHPCNWCSSPLNISSISLETCLIFSRFNIVSNPVLFLPIFNFTLITCHNIMACDLESHSITIKHFFGMWQPHVQYFP